MELDQSEREAFINEVEDRLEAFGDVLLEFEANPDRTDLLNRLFRVAHTIKGNAGFVQLENMVRLAHSMETMLERIREGRFPLTRQRAGALLEGGDNLKKILDEFAAGGDANAIPVAELSDRIDALIEGESATPDVSSAPEPSGSAAISPAQNPPAGSNAFTIRIRLKSEAPLPGMRAYLMRKKLSGVAEITAESPPVEEYDNTTFNGEIDFSVLTDLDEEGLYRTLRNHEVDTLEVAPLVAPGEPAGETAPGEVLFVSEEEETVPDSSGAGQSAEVLRVPVKKIDDILNLVGELLSANSSYLALTNDFRKRYGKRGLYNNIRENSEFLTRVSAELQEKVMKVRMIPVGSVMNRFRRLVRDFNADHPEKDIDLEIRGEETEADKKQIDSIYEPLMHLVRNSLDHGIESREEREAAGKPPRGKITLRSFQAGNNIFIEVEDDGKGLDAERIRATAVRRGLVDERQVADLEESALFNFIFLPGFSTAEKLTDISGRGVGMDAVKRNIEGLSGSIQVFSEAGKGSRFSISIPLSMAIVTALKVLVRGRLFAVPISVILETIKITEDDVFLVDQQETIAIREANVPLLRVAREIGMPPINGAGAAPATADGAENDSLSQRKKPRYPVVVVQFGNSRVGLMVEDLIGYEDLVIKSLSRNYEEIDGLAGAAIMGKGEICLILDIHSLITGPAARQSAGSGGLSFVNSLGDMSAPDPVRGASPARRPKPAAKQPPASTAATKVAAPPAKKTKRLSISEGQLAAIKKVIAAGRVNSLSAVRALTENRGLGMKFSTTRVQSMAKFRRQLEELRAGKELHAFDVQLENEFTGHEIVLISRTSMLKLAGMMYAEPEADALNPRTISAITEVANILAVSFTNAISIITGKRVLPGVPDHVPDIQALFQRGGLSEDATVLLVETEFTHENQETMLHLFFFLSPEDIQKMEIKRR